jgi:histidinol-phosphate phosphatase family protein
MYLKYNDRRDTEAQRTANDLMTFKDLHINENWTLFLDRDGVINVEKDADYIRRKDEFVFSEGALPAMPLFAARFPRIFVVTNQKGIGKGLMTEGDLDAIHTHMLEQVAAVGGRIDKVYYCPDLDEKSPNRKPNPGMGLQAAQEHPEIDFSRSLMVGNTMGDMQFGKTLGMTTVFIPSTKPMPDLPHPLVDFVAPDLFSLAKALSGH